MTFGQVCDNVGDHLIGNVYARYEWEAEAQAAVDNLNDRWYAGTFLFKLVVPSDVLRFAISQDDPFTRNCHQSRTSAKPVVDKTKTENATEAVSATSCTCGLPRRSLLNPYGRVRS